MLRVRMGKKVLWLLAALLVLPMLWILEIEFTYERNVRHGIPADFRMYSEHTVVMWKA